MNRETRPLFSAAALILVAASVAAMFGFSPPDPSRPVTASVLTGLLIVAGGALVGGSLAILGFLRRETPWCFAAAAASAGVWVAAWFWVR